MLAPEEAYQLLTSRRPPVGTGEQEQARLLAEDLGRHALALDVTASALQNSVAAKPFAGFRAKLAKPDKDALKLAEALSDALPNGHEKSIAQTMLRSIQSLGPEGMDFLRLASVLAVAPIPASLVTAVFKNADKLNDEDAELRASLALKQVTAASLAERAGEKQDSPVVHTLVSRTVRFQDKSKPGRTEALREAAVKALWAAIAKVAEDPRIRGESELFATHARQLVTNTATLNEANLLGWLGIYDNVRGSYTSARALRQRDLEFRIQAQGEEHPDTLTARSNLALTLKAQGDLAGARQHEEQVLAARRQMQGEEHPHTLTARLNLAETLWAQGDLASARQHQEQVLAARRRLLGEEHPDTLTARSNLAVTLHTQGDLAGARLLREQVLVAWRRLLGEEHPHTLTARSNLAATLYAQGDLAGAQQQQEETLAVRRRVLGPEHPDTLLSMSHVAATLIAQKELASARKLLQETLAMQRRTLGSSHRDTTRSARNLAQTLLNLGESAAAREILDGDLRWLLDRDPTTLGAEQRNDREWVAGVVKESG